MKKIMILTMILFAFFVENVFAKSICDHVNIDWIKTQVPLPSESKIIHKEDRFGVCEIVLDINGQVAPLYAGENFIIAGQMMKDKEQITGKVLQSLEPVINKAQEQAMAEEKKRQEQSLKIIKNNFSVIKDMVSISYNPNKTKNKIYVITDPLCGYCTKTLEFLKPLAETKNFSIEVVIYPIFGEQSAPLVNKAITDNFSLDKYIDSTWKQKDYSKLEKSSEFLKVRKLGDENFKNFNFNAVPVILGENASFMVIGADFKKIEEHINSFN
jgi:thiol:disulfide interchange protein DsbC